MMILKVHDGSEVEWFANNKVDGKCCVSGIWGSQLNIGKVW
jgi:hypothetical protein